MSRFLTTAEVAEILGVSKQTIYRWLQSGRIPHPLRDPSNAYRYWTVEEVATIRKKIPKRWQRETNV